MSLFDAKFPDFKRIRIFPSEPIHALLIKFVKENEDKDRKKVGIGFGYSKEISGLHGFSYAFFDKKTNEFIKHILYRGKPLNNYVRQNWEGLEFITTISERDSSNKKWRSLSVLIPVDALEALEYK